MANELQVVGAAAPVPLSADEEAAWELLVETGRAIRAPIVARQAERREKMPAWAKKANTGAKDSLAVVPDAVRRWVVLRMAGMSFKRSFEASGATWLQVQEARAHNESFRCAVAAMEENSRQLMKAKAQSIVELSQDEDARVSMAQTQVSMRILESLDRDHFGESREEAAEEAVAKAVGNGGFVINLIQDAARVADAAPAVRPAKAVVYADV